MTIETIAVTGGNGKIGEAILDHLSDYNYETVNVARGKQREDISDRYVTTDLLDAGETYGALAKYGADAVVHMGTIPDPYSNPDFRVYESNVLSAVHVLGAADELGLESVCLASSINALGSEHQERPADVRYIPVNESHPRTPDDSYGIAKHAMEVTADGFGRRPSCDLTISSLRYPWVTTDAEMREAFVETDRSLDVLCDVHPATGRNVLFSYLAMADAASIARKAVEAGFEGRGFASRQATLPGDKSGGFGQAKKNPAASCYGVRFPVFWRLLLDKRTLNHKVAQVAVARFQKTLPVQNGRRILEHAR